MTERARKSQTLAGENSFQKHLQLRLPCMLRAHERGEPSHVFRYKERRANVGKRKGEAPCDAGRVPHGHRETGRGRGGAASGAPGLGTDGDAGGRHGQRGPGRRVTKVPAMLLWTQRKGPGIALDLGPDPIGHIQPQDQEGVRGSRRTAGKASAGNCLLVLCHAHHMTPSSLPPEKKRGGAAPHPRTRSSGRARGGSGPRGRRALLIASCASCRRTGAPHSQGVQTQEPQVSPSPTSGLPTPSALHKCRKCAALIGCFAARLGVALGVGSVWSLGLGHGRPGSFWGKQRSPWTPRRPCAGWMPGPEVPTQAACATCSVHPAGARLPPEVSATAGRGPPAAGV